MLVWNHQSGYLNRHHKRERKQGREIAQPRAKLHTQTSTQTTSNTQKSHSGIQPKWPHVMFPFYSSDFSHTHTQLGHKLKWHQTTRPPRKRHGRPSCPVTVNPVNGRSVCFLSASTHFIEWDEVCWCFCLLPNPCRINWGILKSRLWEDLVSRWDRSCSPHIPLTNCKVLPYMLIWPNQHVLQDGKPERHPIERTTSSWSCLLLFFSHCRCI